ncbi:MAG: hypothetical protein OEZ06_29510 [Myxococcales bacterium]|nr:hypothetical protein [Myxococcales bacterium]
MAPLRDAAGAIVGVIGMASHGAPGRAERNRRHARGAMRVLAALIGGIAHDVNNALTIIKSYNQFLLESLDPQSESWEDADVIHQAVVRSGRQVAALAAFSRKQLENALQPGLSAVVQGIEPVLPRFVGKNVQVELSLEPNLPPVSMSREQLEQVIMDFAAVAREAMPHGGSLSIATATERLPSPRYERLSHLPDGRYASLQLISSAAPGRRTSLYPPDSGEVDSVVLMARDAAAYIEQVARDHGGGALIEEREDGRTVAVLLPGTA